MPYAFLNPDGTIKQVVPKPTPQMRIGPGERLVRYDPPNIDDAMYVVVPEVPVAEGAQEIQFTVHPRPAAEAWVVVRRRRSKLLAECDWTQMPDVAMDTKTAWAAYRQDLRDITEQPDPHNLVWPTPPG